MEALKPCPFCGGEAEVTEYNGGFAAVGCANGRCYMKPHAFGFPSAEAAAEEWNRRAERTCRYVYDREICAWRCSECGGLEPVGDHVRYCPDCGAMVVGCDDASTR